MKPLLALLGAAVMISLAGPAYGNGGGAPPGDPNGGAAPDVNSEAAQSFLAALRAAGITYSRADQAIIAAEAVCKLVGDGKSGPEVLKIIVNRNPGLTEDHAAKFLAMAERSYCPQQLAPSAPETAEAPPG